MTPGPRLAGTPRGAGKSPPPTQPALSVCLSAAADVVAAVLDGHTPEAALQAVAAPVRPAAMDLALSCLRAFGRGDFALQRLLERPLKDARVRGLLLVALARLEARPDQAHTIVDQAVVAAEKLAGGHFKGMVNGVLRSFERRREELLGEADANEVARWLHPAWWIARLKHDQPQQWQAILAAGNSRPPMSLRLNQRRIADADARAALLQEFEAAGIGVRNAANGALELERPVPVERLPGFAAGLCSVQDGGAQQAANLIDCANGMRVLDACSAPGGKTAHLLEAYDLDLLALDADAARAARVTDNLSRLGLVASVVAEDCRDLTKWWDGRPFDRILADVPCTASGVVRRHPDAKWLRRAGDVVQFARTQAEILDSLWPTLAPGGKLLYVTCSVFATENRDQVAAFVGRHADAIPVPLPMAADGTCQMQLLPDAAHDGFFYALLQRQ
jgi:16S rRNA (cytosine967-C5)-methyltransferase